MLVLIITETQLLVITCHSYTATVLLLNGVTPSTIHTAVVVQVYREMCR